MFYVFIFLFGLVMGSFLNVVILRLKTGEKIFIGRSHCPHCQKILSTVDLIPLFSFAVLRGRCRYCQEKISWQYPLVEAAVGALFVWATHNLIGGLGPSWLLVNQEIFWHWIRDLTLIFFLVAIFVYDLRWYEIPDRLTLPAILAALAFNLFLGYRWQSLIIGLVVGLGFFLLQYLISRGRWIGGGDLRLGALLGAILGWPQVVVALFFAYIVGAAISLVLVAFGLKKFKSMMPFGVFLSAAAIFTIFYGSGIVAWYSNLL